MKINSFLRIYFPVVSYLCLKGTEFNIIYRNGHSKKGKINL